MAWDGETARFREKGGAVPGSFGAASPAGWTPAAAVNTPSFKSDEAAQVVAPQAETTLPQTWGRVDRPKASRVGATAFDGGA
jgi:hypothetical protein